jgi:AcrR family transcriptional regulator
MATLGASAQGGRPLEPPAEGAPPEVRQRIADAGRDLFLTQGYDRTTVDAIAERAGVARRTFFRYFRSKDDVIFPDHDRIAQLTAAHLDAVDDQPALRAVCSGARQILRSYVDDGQVSVERYRLIRSVPALRDREIATVSQYTRLFSRYLRRRLGDAPGAALKAESAASAIVAAHNHVLREWLRGGGAGDPFPALDDAFGWVLSRFEDRPAEEHPDAPAADEAGTGVAGEGAESDSSVVVAVFRAGDPLDDVVERISRSL